MNGHSALVPGRARGQIPVHNYGASGAFFVQVLRIRDCRRKTDSGAMFLVYAEGFGCSDLGNVQSHVRYQPRDRQPISLLIGRSRQGTLNPIDSIMRSAEHLRDALSSQRWLAQSASGR